MRSVVNHAVYGEIVYDESLTGKKKLFFNGKELQSSGKNTYVTADGEKVFLHGSLLSGVRLTIKSENIQVVKVPAWYVYLLAVLPFVLIIVWGNSVKLCSIVPVVGGLIGGMISAVMAVISFILMTKVKSGLLKLLIGIGFLAATFLVCALIGYAMLSIAAAVA